MVHGDPKQQKLPFEKHTGTDMSTAASTAKGGATRGLVQTQMVGAEDTMVELCIGFHVIDSKFETLTTRLGGMEECLGRQQAHLESTEERISGLENGTAKLIKWLDKMESRLRTVAIKNEDL
ncbi:hypothetical protein NDU88_006236 [Pleurodeles waltl]|uniref:Uncharacterized protein n=1 Tax=Pleurodeles waltl TaxID=8319 RepID=A0AAV7NPM6_PLEWA|nr:hypothetical protein NDU88_006236 [Pleurodeles waltl]